MRLEFGLLAINNFKSVRKLELDLGKYQPGLHFLRGRNLSEPPLGSNGAGKSTVFDALCWALFGKTPGGLRNPDVRPWHAGAGVTQVELQLWIDGVEHWIARTIAPNKITWDDKEISQESLEAQLGMWPKFFFNAIVLGQGQPLYLDLEPKDKLEILNEARGLERWEERAARASDLVKKLIGEHQALEGRLTTLHSNLEQAEQLRATANRQAGEWEETRQGRLDDMRTQLKKKAGELEITQARLDEALVEQDSAGTEAQAEEIAIRKLMQAQTNALRALDRAEGQIETEKQALTRLERELEGLAGADRCPTCGQPVKRDGLAQHRKELQEEIAATKKIIKTGVDPTLTKEVTNAGKTLTAAEAHYKRFKDRLDKADAAVRLYMPQQAALSTAKQSLQAQLKTMEEAVNPHREQIDLLRRKERGLKAEIAQSERDVATALKSLENARFWVTGFKDLRLNIIQETLHDIEDRANRMLPEIGLVDWELQFDIEKETQAGTIKRGLNVTVLSPSNRKPVRWENWSGGEGQRLRVVGALALSETLLDHMGIQTDLEILDEPTQHVSPEGVRDIGAFLAERAEAWERRIFWVDHLAVENAHFASVTVVIKDKQGTRLEEK